GTMGWMLTRRLRRKVWSPRSVRPERVEGWTRDCHKTQPPRTSRRKTGRRKTSAHGSTGSPRTEVRARCGRKWVHHTLKWAHHERKFGTRRSRKRGSPQAEAGFVAWGSEQVGLISRVRRSEERRIGKEGRDGRATNQ